MVRQGVTPVSGTPGAQSNGSGAPSAPEPVLEIEDLKAHFFTAAGVVKAVDGVSWSVRRGETLGVVGESGCGKSVTALSILRLLPEPPGRIVGGRVRFQGRDLLALGNEQMEAIRGNDISMVFQEPMTSLNPLFTVGQQIGEAIVVHEGVRRRVAHERAVEMLRRVSVPAPEQRAASYPHQLS